MKDDWIDLSNLGEICYFDLGILLFLLKLLCIIYRRGKRYWRYIEFFGKYRSNLIESVIEFEIERLRAN